MDTATFNRIDELRVAFVDVVRGHSVAPDGKLFVKHLSELELLDANKFRFLTALRLKKDGVPTIKERDAQLAEEGLWTADKNQRLLDLEVQIKDNEKNLPNILVAQQPLIRKVIVGLRNELAELHSEHEGLLGATAEHYAERDTYSYILFLSMFKDEKLTVRLWPTVDEALEASYEDTADISRAFQAAMEQVGEKTLREISVMPFFLNIFSHSKDDIARFYNRPLLELSSPQFTLAQFGRRNFDTLTQSEVEPPMMEGDTNIEDIIKWYDLQTSLIETKRRGGGSGEITKTVREVRK